MVNLFNTAHVNQCISPNAVFHIINSYEGITDAHIWSFGQDSVTNASKSYICYIHQLLDHHLNLMIIYFPRYLLTFKCNIVVKISIAIYPMQDTKIDEICFKCLDFF